MEETHSYHSRVVRVSEHSSPHIFLGISAQSQLHLVLLILLLFLSSLVFLCACLLPLLFSSFLLFSLLAFLALRPVVLPNKFVREEATKLSQLSVLRCTFSLFHYVPVREVLHTGGDADAALAAEQERGVLLLPGRLPAHLAVTALQPAHRPHPLSPGPRPNRPRESEQLDLPEQAYHMALPCWRLPVLGLSGPPPVLPVPPPLLLARDQRAARPGLLPHLGYGAQPASLVWPFRGQTEPLQTLNMVGVGSLAFSQI